MRNILIAAGIGVILGLLLPWWLGLVLAVGIFVTAAFLTSKASQ